MKRSTSYCAGIAGISLTLLSSNISTLQAGEATIQVYPEITRSIKGISEVERDRYFAICDTGTFDKKVKNQAMYDYLVKNIGIKFGRKLGVVEPAVKWEKSVKEDPNRPGFADIEYLKSVYAKKQPKFSERFMKDFGPSLNIAAHGNHNGFPTFMGENSTDWTRKEAAKGGKTGHHARYYPKNIDAAAELSAAVLKYGYNDFNRPAYYEPLNEPHWSFVKNQDFADWHVKTKEAVTKLNPDVKVGGYCNSVSYFFNDNYKSWWNYETFLKQTEGKLDFYSFHTYDYVRIVDGETKGRIQSGLPLESVIDMASASTTKLFGKEKPIVISEHGGYIGSQPKGRYDGDVAVDAIVNKHFPKESFKGTDWEWEMKKRSIVDFVHVSSILTNTMTFLDHPHVVEKAVPFILFNTWNWSKHYYANLYVPYNYEDKSKWVPTQMINFYKFFKGVKGRRVKLLNSEADVQANAFVDGKKLFVALNNLSAKPETISLSGINAKNAMVRRVGRNADYTAYYKVEMLKNKKSITLSGREAVMIVAESASEIKAKATVNEIPCYADTYGVKVRKGKPAAFTVKVPTNKKIDYAILRVGLTQKADTAQGVTIALNGKQLTVPAEDCAVRLLDREKKNEFATIKMIRINPADLRASNEVTVTFPNDEKKLGAVGAVVIRAGVLN